jgi:hypothetical protein
MAETVMHSVPVWSPKRHIYTIYFSMSFSIKQCCFLGGQGGAKGHAGTGGSLDE